MLEDLLQHRSLKGKHIEHEARQQQAFFEQKY